MSGKSTVEFREEVTGCRVVVVTSVTKTIDIFRQIFTSNGIGEVTYIKQYQNTFDEIKANKFDIVICDWSVGDVDGAGLKIIEQIRQCKDLENTATIVMSSQADQNHVCNAVDTEIDSFIVKPFNANTVAKCMNNAYESRMNPSDYAVSVKEARELLESKDFESARGKFYESLILSEKPANAHYFLGYIEMVENSFDDAMTEFENGLEHRPMHLKSLYGRAFAIENGNRDPVLLQKALEDILEVFPVHANSLKMLMPILIKNKDYEKAAETLGFMLKVRGEFPKLNDLIAAYFSLIIKGTCTRDNHKVLDELLPGLKAFQHGREKFSWEFILLLMDYGMDDMAKVEYVNFVEEYGRHEEIEYRLAKKLFDMNNHYKCLEACHELIKEMGKTEKILKLIVDCYETLEDEKRLAEFKEELEIFQRQAAAEKAKAAKEEAENEKKAS